MNSLPAPHGGELVDLYLRGDALDNEKARAAGYPAWTLTDRQLSDIELLLNGGFSPLTGYLNRADYEAVLEGLHLQSGLLWPLPLVLDVTETFAETIEPGSHVALYDPEGLLIATLEVENIWAPDLAREACHCIGTDDSDHPGAALILSRNPVCLGGRLKGITPPPRYAFSRYRFTPAELRHEFARRSWGRTLAFHSSRPMFSAQIELASRCAREQRANLIIHPAVDNGRDALVDDFTRMRCYELALATLPEQTTLLAAVPLTSRFAGPREALLHAIVRQNFGLTLMIVGDDHAGAGERWADSSATQQLIEQYQTELKIGVVPVENFVFVEARAEFLPRSEVPAGASCPTLDDAELERRLELGLPIPDWFAPPAIIDEIRRARPPRHRQGFTVFFTGLSGSGKSTLAHALMQKLREQGDRSVSLLDGDIVRHNLSSELGFSREHRDLNIRRIGFVASEITKAGGIAICAPIAPYRETRRQVRRMISKHGGFIEVHVATPLEVCEARDRKGLYAKARKGLIKEFTGISDPYETPENAEVVIDTSTVSSVEAANRIMLTLEQLGYIK